jgi:histidyl-tRNA synthetase
MGTEKIEPRVLKGFRDFLPDVELERKRIETVLTGVFESFGFVPIDTPALEYTEVLLGKGGGETDKQIYRFLDHGERDVALRFDLTVPFARYMAAHRHDLYTPFKRYHISKVWRGENTQRGRFREFTQCDFDIVGVDSPSADFEILTMMHDTMKGLGVPDFTIRLSNRQVFNRFLSHLGITEKSAEILRTVDKVSKIGRDKTQALLEDSVTPDQAARILDFIEPAESFEATLHKMSDLAGGTAEDTRRLETTWTYITECGMEERFFLDPSITRGLDYYTGIVFETFLDEIPDIGSVCSGGRYNDLASLYTKEHLPGVGASIGLDRLMAALESLNRLTTGGASSELLILCIQEMLYPHYHRLAGRFREAGISSEVYPEKKKLAQQFQFAERKGIRFGLICGEDELERGTVTIKNLVTRESFEDLSLEDAISRVRAPVEGAP